jgi:hypothetical protein
MSDPRTHVHAVRNDATDNFERHLMTVEVEHID